MMTIWYFAATNGDTPARICPVIIPGKATNPTAKKVLMEGMSATVSALLRASYIVVDAGIVDDG